MRAWPQKHGTAANESKLGRKERVGEGCAGRAEDGLCETAQAVSGVGFQGQQGAGSMQGAREQGGMHAGARSRASRVLRGPPPAQQCHVSSKEASDALHAVRVAARVVFCSRAILLPRLRWRHVWGRGCLEAPPPCRRRMPTASNSRRRMPTASGGSSSSLEPPTHAAPHLQARPVDHPLQLHRLVLGQQRRLAAGALFPLQGLGHPRGGLQRRHACSRRSSKVAITRQWPPTWLRRAQPAGSSNSHDGAPALLARRAPPPPRPPQPCPHQGPAGR